MINIRAQYLLFLKEEKLSQQDIPYSTYTEIIKLHNKEVMKSLIREDKVFNMGFKLGKLMIIEIPIKTRISANGQLISSINWPESNKQKEKLIKEGQLPLKNFKDENNKIIGNNGGVAWYVYNTNDSKPVFYWDRLRVKKEERDLYILKNSKSYQLDMVPRNIQLMYSAMFTDNLRFNKVKL